MLFPWGCFWEISYCAWARDPAPSPSLLRPCQHQSSAEVSLCCCKGCGTASLRALCSSWTLFSCPVALKKYLLVHCWEERCGLYQICVKLQADRVFAWLENPKETAAFSTFNLTSNACRPLLFYHCLKEEQIRKFTIVTRICAKIFFLFLDLFESLCWTIKAEY